MIRMHIATFALLVVASGCEDRAAAPKVPEPTLLETGNAVPVGLRYSPDGSHVTYWTPGTDGFDLIIAKSDMSGARAVSTHNAQTWPMAWSTDGKQLAFASSATNVADIYVVSADTGAARQVTSGPGYEIPNSWNARDQIVYQASTEGEGVRGFILDLRTGQSLLLPSAETPIARWAPDGRTLGMAGFGAVSSLWVADSVGGNARRLTTEGMETEPVFSPDGTEIAYTSGRTGTGDIWVVPVNGGAPRQLTRDIRADVFPRWSPDGKWIAFHSQRGRQSDLWIVPSAGGPEMRMTDDADEELSQQWISPTKIAFTTGRTGNAIWALNVNDGTERRLTPDSIETGELNPSPDGKEVAFEVVRGGGVSDLQVMPIAGGPARTIATGGAINTQPNWSPDGKSILFLSNRAGSIDVWIVSAAGGEPRRVTDFPTPESNPQWSGDGSTIYFTSRYEAAPFTDVWKVPVAGGTPTRLTRSGAVNGLAVSLVTGDVLVLRTGGKDGRQTLARVTADGKLQDLWDRSNVTGLSWLGYTPKADSFAINADLPDGSAGSYLVSTKTGQGRQLLASGDQVGDFSPDGRWLGYWTGKATLDLGMIDMKDGTHRQLTHSPESESSYWWTADNTILFSRQWQRRKIAVVDVSKLLPGAR